MAFSIAKTNRALVLWILSFLTGLGTALAQAVPWDTFSDTWTATDDLGRALPGHAEVGDPRPGRQVGIFYFLWLGRHGERGPFDISHILRQDPAAMNKPDSPLWGPLHAPHHWGESIFGYYVSDDASVLRKHAQMLADAGVDAVIFDVSNQLTYPESWRALARAFAEVRRHGQTTPRFAFLCPFWTPSKVVRELYTTLYEPGFHPELWYRWEGKPLILADPDLLGGDLGQLEHDHPARLDPGRTLGQSFRAEESFISVAVHTPTWETSQSKATLTLRRAGPAGDIVLTQRFESIQDNAWLTLSAPSPWPAGDYHLELSRAEGPVGWWSHTQDRQADGQAFADGEVTKGDRVFRVRLRDGLEAEIHDFFTFRKPQPDYFTGPTGPGQWGWLEVHPQHVFYKTPGVPEQMTAGVAQNAVDGKLSVLSNPRAHGRSFHNGRQPGPAGQDFQGHNFAEQWKRALEVDPPFIFITGWNEWIAGRFRHPSGFYGDGPVTFVDQFNREYSRDIEPMKGGHGDAFYYQMIGQIRRFKGVRSLPSVTSGPIRIDGRFDDWRDVQPEFRDTIGDPARRDHRGWGRDQHYVNATGRRDLVAAKVSADRDHIYVFVRTREPLESEDAPSGLMLFLNSDGNPTNGWMGYDAVINRHAANDSRLLLERHDRAGYRWRESGRVPFRARGDAMELAVPRAALGWEKELRVLEFKWADHLEETGDWSDFTLHGDAAPNDRYNYRAVFADPGRANE